MKAICLAAAVLVVLGGCAPALNVQDNTFAATAAGVRPSQIEFMAYCDFGDVPPGAKHPGGNGGNGLILLTSDSLILMNGDLPNVTVKRRFKYREINGVDVKHVIRAYQLQIIRGDVITVMTITKNKALIDQGATNHAAQILRQHGVPSWQSPHYFQPKIPPPTIIPIPIPVR